MGRRENVDVFEDTRRLYSSNPVLKDAVENACQKQEPYLEGTEVDGSIVQRDMPARIVVIDALPPLTEWDSHSSPQRCV